MALAARAFFSGEFAPTRGQEEHVFQAGEDAQTFNIGDLLFQHPTSRKPRKASSMVDQGSEPLNQDAFQQFFLGVSEQRKIAGDTDRKRIATRGVKDFDCVSDTYVIGDLLAVDESAGGVALENRKLVKTTVISRAIARVNKDSGAAAVRVEAFFVSTIMHGGLQSMMTGSSSGTV